MTANPLLLDVGGDWNPFARSDIPVGALSTGRPSDDGVDAAEGTIANIIRDAIGANEPEAE